MPKKKDDSQVLHNIASHLNRNMKKPTETPEDLIMKQASKGAFNRMQNTHVVADGDPTPTKSKGVELPKPAGKVYPMPIGGYTLPLVGIPTVDMTSILAMILCLESDHNPRIKGLLDEAKFQMKDMNEKQIYPRQAPIKKKKRKKRARSKKR